ncbi:LPXTG cell wall anchor domain-containing protein, partial [Leuconostoc suionicum]|uniref:LPXTG cell wall anchor domain-containing protein n=1 Tax=Leuconostoc suionicum TaxID=1511761 RepID=UPI004034FAB2
PSSEVPSSETPSSEVPSSETPSSEVPSSETPSSEVPSSETSSSEVPSSETPSSKSNHLNREYNNDYLPKTNIETNNSNILLAAFTTLGLAGISFKKRKK